MSDTHRAESRHDAIAAFEGMNVFRTTAECNGWRLYRGPFHYSASRDIAKGVSLSLTAVDVADVALQMDAVDASL